MVTKGITKEDCNIALNIKARSFFDEMLKDIYKVVNSFIHKGDVQQDIIELQFELDCVMDKYITSGDCSPETRIIPQVSSIDPYTVDIVIKIKEESITLRDLIE